MNNRNKFTLLLILIFIFLFTGCTTQNSSPVKSTSSTKNSDATLIPAYVVKQGSKKWGR